LLQSAEGGQNPFYEGMRKKLGRRRKGSPSKTRKVIKRYEGKKKKKARSRHRRKEKDEFEKKNPQKVGGGERKEETPPLARRKNSGKAR